MKGLRKIIETLRKLLPLTHYKSAATVHPESKGTSLRRQKIKFFQRQLNKKQKICMCNNMTQGVTERYFGSI
jgi:hypothetical protein